MIVFNLHTYAQSSYVHNIERAIRERLRALKYWRGGVEDTSNMWWCEWRASSGGTGRLSVYNTSWRAALRRTRKLRRRISVRERRKWAVPTTCPHYTQQYFPSSYDVYGHASSHQYYNHAIYDNIDENQNYQEKMTKENHHCTNLIKQYQQQTFLSLNKDQHHHFLRLHRSLTHMANVDDIIKDLFSF